MTLLRSSFTGLATALLLAGPSRAGTFTVDDDGPADFASITAAIAGVAAGDVLLVMPGRYDAFTLDKPLTILGPGDGPRPIVNDLSVVAAPSVTLAGLRFDALRLSGVAGAASVDDCLIGHAALGNLLGCLDVGNCGQLLVSRCVIDGNAPPPGDGGNFGLHLEHSVAAFVDCTVTGGDAASAAAGECAMPSHSAAFVSMGSVQFTACALVGGQGGITNCFFGGGDGTSGFGLMIQQGKHDLRGGTMLDAGSGDPGWEGDFGYALDVSDAILVLEPTTIGTGGLHKGGTTIITAGVPEPVLRVLADTPQAPGGSGQLEWTAPSGAPGILLVSLGGEITSLKKLQGSLWPQLPALIELPITAGPGPTRLPYTLPNDSSLIASVITLQAIFPTVPGAQTPNKVAITNPTQIVIRF